MKVQVCPLCNSESSAGENYKIYFGNTIDSFTTYGRNYTSTRTTYKIAGSKELFICDKCFAERNRLIPKSLAIPILELSFGILLLVSMLIFGRDTIGFMLIGVVSALAIGFDARMRFLSYQCAKKHDYSGAIKVLKVKRDELGDRLLIEIYEQDLKAQGYSSYFTRFDYSKLK